MRADMYARLRHLDIDQHLDKFGNIYELAK